MKTQNSLIKKMRMAISRRLPKFKKHDAETGTTFIEVLVTIAIIAILMTTIAIAVIPFIGGATRAKVISDIGALNTAMTAYYIEHSDYPDPGTWTDDVKKYLQDGKAPMDPWTKDAFKYSKPGPEDHPYEIRSSGEDKTEGTDDDIVSWKLDEKKEKDQNNQNK